MVLHNIFVSRGLKHYGKIAFDAIADELLQLFRKKEALMPVRYEDIEFQHRKKIIRSHMFLKHKFDGLGWFEKMKARLVADGRCQKKEDLNIAPAPTASCEAIFSILKLICIEGRKVLVVDVGGAYLNAVIDDEYLYMELTPQLTAIAVQIMPELEAYISKNSTKLIVRLGKALYGLVQSARLWYDTLVRVLVKEGFTANTVDECVWNKTIEGRQVSVVVYVDDLLISSIDDNDLHYVRSIIEKEFKDIKVKDGSEFTYLGMFLKFIDNHKCANTRKEFARKIEVNTVSYVDAVLKEWGKLRTYITPADETYVQGSAILR